MSQFAKLYERDGQQILVVRDENSDCEPCIRFSTKPKSLGVCSIAPSWDDDDEGHKKADEYFQQIDEAAAFVMLDKIVKMTEDFVVND